MNQVALVFIYNLGLASEIVIERNSHRCLRKSKAIYLEKTQAGDERGEKSGQR